MSTPVSNVGKTALMLSRFDCRAHSKRERFGCRSNSRRERCVCRVHLPFAEYAQKGISAVVECTRQPMRRSSALDKIARALGKDILAHATNVHLRWTGVSRREARKTRCAHVAENQFHDYLEHATNTEHASLIIHTHPTNVNLRWTGVSHRDARKTRCARTFQKTNSTIT